MKGKPWWVALLAATLMGASEPRFPEERPGGGPADEARSADRRPGESKKEHDARVKGELKRIGERLEAMKQDAKRLSEEKRDWAEKRLGELNEQRKKLEERASELRRKSKAAWADAKPDLERALESLRKGLEKVERRVKGD